MSNEYSEGREIQHLKSPQDFLEFVKFSVCFDYGWLNTSTVYVQRKISAGLRAIYFESSNPQSFSWYLILSSQ